MLFTLKQTGLPGVWTQREFPETVPGAYGVSKKAGCTYPAKMFDDETRRLEHAMRHARVLENVFGSDTAAGSLGWCMSDYQTRRGSQEAVMGYAIMG